MAGPGTLAERLLRPCVGWEEHWHHEYTPRKGLTWPDSPLHSEYTLQKDHIDRHIALRAV